MFKQILLKASNGFLFFCLLAFPVMAEENTESLPSSIQRCEEDPGSAEKTCKEIYTYPSIICSTIDECVEMVEKQMSELSGIHEYLESCKADMACQRTCKEIYSHSNSILSADKCIGLSWRQVRRLKQTYEALKNPTEENLESINLWDFGLFVDIDPYPLQTLLEKLPRVDATKILMALIIRDEDFVKILFAIEDGHLIKTLIENMDPLSAKELLAWIAEHRDITEVFKKHDSDYQLLPNLLIKVHENARTAISMDISNEENESLQFSFMQKTVEANNKDALKWVHNFFTARCRLISKTSFEEVFCVFKHWYCKVNPTQDGYWEDLLDYEDFEDVVNEILFKYTTDSPPRWWDDHDAVALRGRQLKSICEMDLQLKEEEQTEEDSYINGVISNINPITEISEGQIVYYVGLGKSQRVESLLQFWHPEGKPCNVQFGAELKALGGLHEDGESMWLEIADKELHGEEGNFLCTRSSKFFAPKKLLSETKPVFLPFDYLADYSVNQVDDFTKGDIVYYKGSAWFQIKNTLDLFKPDHNFYTNRCVIESTHRLKILGFSEDGQFVLLEVYNENAEGTNCNKGVQFISPKETISKTPK